MKRKHYRVVLIPSVICIILMSFLTWYVLSVVNKSDALEIIDGRIEVMCSELEGRIQSSENMSEYMYESYRSRARAVAIILSRDIDLLSGETSLEETRVATGAEAIYVADSNGVIVYSTEMSSDETRVLEAFMPAAKDKTFSEAVILKDDSSAIYAGASRLDEPGIIQIKYSPESFRHSFGIDDIAVATPIMKRGYLALVDGKSGEYLSHTDINMIGMAMHFPAEEFSEEQGNFATEYGAEDVLLSYKKYGEYIVIGMLPDSEIYTQRNVAVVGVAFSMSVLSGVLTLSLRNYVLRKLVKFKNKNNNATE